MYLDRKTCNFVGLYFLVELVLYFYQELPVLT